MLYITQNGLISEVSQWRGVSVESMGLAANRKAGEPQICTSVLIVDQLAVGTVSVADAKFVVLTKDIINQYVKNLAKAVTNLVQVRMVSSGGPLARHL